MKPLRGVLIAAFIMLAVAGAQSNPISFRSEYYIVTETTLPDGSIDELLIPATQALPGHTVEYRVFATNAGSVALPARVVQIYGPIQSGVEYVDGSATPTSNDVRTEFSVDGEEFSEAPVLVGPKSNRRIAGAAEYTLIRWTLLTPMAVGQEEEFVYRVKLLAAPPASEEFKILSVSQRWEGDRLYVVGELQNVSGTAMGVELQAIARDAAGRLVDTVNFWPASISNIAPGARYGFRHLVTQQRDAVSVEVQVVSTIAW